MNENYDMDADPADSFSRGEFEKLYIALREKEHRLYTDDQVARLPFIKSPHPHAAEWATRKRSTTRLIHYLGKSRRPLTILETGCGNGWLCGRLGELQGTFVTGIDINESELNQAKRVFRNKVNIQFRIGDMNQTVLNQKFDIVVFAASIQYFPSLNQIIERSLSVLNPGGEIHILDSPFYSNSEITNAESRSDTYYRSIGYEEMTKFYFHHSLVSVENFNYKILYNPFRSLNKLLMRRDPFPWICIKAS